VIKIYDVDLNKIFEERAAHRKDTGDECVAEVDMTIQGSFLVVLSYADALTGGSERLCWAWFHSSFLKHHIQGSLSDGSKTSITEKKKDPAQIQFSSQSILKVGGYRNTTSEVITFPKAQIDNACKDVKHKKFPKGFSLELTLNFGDPRLFGRRNKKKVSLDPAACQTSTRPDKHEKSNPLNAVENADDNKHDPIYDSYKRRRENRSELFQESTSLLNRRVHLVTKTGSEVSNVTLAGSAIHLFCRVEIHCIRNLELETGDYPFLKIFVEESKSRERARSADRVDEGDDYGSVASITDMKFLGESRPLRPEEVEDKDMWWGYECQVLMDVGSAAEASYLNGRLALQLPSTLRISIHSMKSPEQPLGEFRLPLDPAFTDGVSGQLYQWLPFCRPSRYIKYPHSRLVRSSRLLSDQDLLVPPSEQDRDEDLKYELLSNSMISCRKNSQYN